MATMVTSAAMTAWHAMDAAEVVARLETRAEGLRDDEVRARRRQYGEHALVTPHRASAWRIVVRQFVSPLMLILLAAVGVSAFIGEWRDVVVIAAAIAINVAVGFAQEWKAERAAEALRSYEVPHTRVRRNGRTQEIPARDVVPGDIILLSSGDRVPSDMRLLRATELEVDEALLTGESYPVAKQTAAISARAGVADQRSMALMGTMVVRGKGEGVVVATGAQTRFGALTQLVRATRDEHTPLQQQMRHFGRVLGLVVITAAAGLFAVGVWRDVALVDMLRLSIALAVAAVPEGLMVSLTVILAIGMQRMFRRKALVRRLIAAETLGSVSVVCTDKTGTLTEGHLSAARVVTPRQSSDLQGHIPDEVYDLLVAAVLNNDAMIDAHGTALGHPMETALLEAARAAQVPVDAVRSRYARVREVPFSSSQKFMATWHAGESHDRLIVKGAPERVWAMCHDGDALERLRQEAEAMTREGLRVLAVAIRDGCANALEHSTMTPLGIIGFHDPLRAEAAEALATLSRAGVRVVIITGDHPETLAHVAHAAGIAAVPERIKTGADIEAMSDADLAAIVVDIDLYARVEPSHKVRIVNAWKARGEVVAMIGDGVNDAAALKAADVGVAVGTAADVTREISDMVLLDNRLATIGEAVREGRIIFDNMRKVVVYLLSDSFSEMVLVAGALLLGVPLPITAAQILWINLVTDGLPNVALTLDPGEPDTMSQPPRSRKEPIINGDMRLLIFLIGIVTDIGLLGLYVWLLRAGNTDAAHLQTMMFTALAVDSLLYVFAVRSRRRSIVRSRPLENRWLVAAVALGVLVQVAVVYVPVLQSAFGTVALSLSAWSVIIGLAMVKLVAIELVKALRHHRVHTYAQRA